MNSQNPWGETLVTSTREVLRPGAADFIQVLLDQFPGFCNLLHFQPVVRVEFNSWFDPELCFAVGMLDMDMRSRLLTREEVEPEPSNAQDGRTHPYKIADSGLWRDAIPQAWQDKLARQA